MVPVLCPVCHTPYVSSAPVLRCASCNNCLEQTNGVWVNHQVAEEKDKAFYDTLYHGDLGDKWVQGLNRSSLFKRFLEHVSLSYRRERFFKKHITGEGNAILDIACGVGRNYLRQYGTVVGVDLSYEALLVAKQHYDLTVQTGAGQLPFADNTFDYVLSSDFFGHVRNEDKDAILREIYRVLKPGGKTIHIIENDSTNLWFRIAHRYPDLFQKYFIEKIGGHVGLELSSACVRRFEAHQFSVVASKKIWGSIWPIQDYASMFGNEYADRVPALRPIVSISRMLGKNKLIRSVVNILLNPVNSAVEIVTRLDHGQGLMLVAKK